MSVYPLAWSMDYIYFFYGLSFMVLSMAAFYLNVAENDQPKKSSWFWLGLFGFTHGLYEWLDLLAFLHFESRLFTVLTGLLLAVSFLFLLEFSRRRTAWLANAKAARILYGLLVLFALSGLPFGRDAFYAAVRFFLAFPAGFLASLALFEESKNRRASGGRTILLLSAVFLVYTIAAGVITPKSDFLLASVVNQEAFARLFGFPVQLLRGLLGFTMAILLSLYSMMTAWLGRRSAMGLALVALLTLIVYLGWFFAKHQGADAARKLETDIRGEGLLIARHVNGILHLVDSAILITGEDPCISSPLVTGKSSDFDLANEYLDRHQKDFGLSVVYLMDARGTTIASSNRDAADSFVGKSYAFRPYFTEARAGRAGKYFALGVTSKKLGYYGSTSVMDEEGKIVGVAVAKKDLDFLDEDFRRYPEALLVSPEGVVIASGRKDLLSRALWPIPAAQRAELTASKQFGEISFEPVLAQEPSGGAYIIFEDRSLYLLRQPLRMAGWSLILMKKTDGIFLARALAIAITLVFSLVIALAFIAWMYSEGSLQSSLALLDLRRKSEAALQKVNAELEVKVQERTLHLSREIEERKIIEAALSQSEARLNEAQSIAHIGSWDWDLGSSALYWSDETYALFGLDKKTFTPTFEAFLNLVCPVDRDRVDKAVRAAVTQRVPCHIEAGIINPDGRVWITEVFGSLTCDNSGNPSRLAGTIQNITERKETEADKLLIERTILTQKYESLGTLAGGIAHQFNNLMNVIHINLEMALMDAQLIPASRYKINNAILAVNRTAELTRQMLSYSGKGRFLVEPIQINDLIKENRQYFAGGVPKTIRFDLHLAEDLPAIGADALQIKQAVLNLVINAAEAIEEKAMAAPAREGGHNIGLSTGIMDCTAEYLQRSRVENRCPPGRFVYIEISDTGCGMDDEAKRRLFDPFFSTKFLGRGLGMPAVLGIMRSHKGALIVDSHLGQGTTIRLLFPAIGD